ncbi:MAG: extracellular solute-binding protein, partial [Patescibacteria group bacterium]
QPKIPLLQQKWIFEMGSSPIMKYRIIILAVIAFLLISSAVIFAFGRKDGGKTALTIEFWGLDEPAAWSAIITAYQTANPGRAIKYVKKDAATYERDLLNALASGVGPDIAAINNTWLNKHQNKFSPMTGGFMNADSFKNTFVDTAAADLIVGNNIYALPFYADTLALYYNKTLFNNAGLVNPPKTWDAFNEAVKELATVSEGGTIGRAGAALGTANNVNHASDILSLLMLQTGTVMVNTNRQASFGQTVSLNSRPYNPGLAALDFYTSFASISKPVYTWNARMPNSLSAFSSGKAAMYLGYAGDLKSIASSAINYSLAPMPQVKDSKTNPDYLDVNFASYHSGAVTQLSRNKTAAWDFLVFATSQNAANSYLTQTRLPTARRDLVPYQATDPVLAVFAKQALTAFNWPQPDDTEVTRIFNRLIDDVAQGRSTSAEAIREAEVEVSNLLK